MTATLLDAAVEYARMGWQVFPCHPTGHQPLVGRGFYAATTDLDVIKSWWSRHPGAAIGLRTGEASGVFAVDIDPRHGGDISLEHLEAEHGELPETVENQTGGGGRHVLLHWPGRTVPCSTGRIGAGIDVKGDGGYIILPPSDHQSGRQYCWLIGQEPEEHEIAHAPEWLLDVIDRTIPPSAPESTAVGEEIPEGYRNRTLAGQAGHMRQIGMTTEEIAPAIQAINLHRCRPPLDADEVERIARSIGRYDPDTCRQAQVECWPERFLAPKTAGGVTSAPTCAPQPAEVVSTSAPLVAYQPFPVDALPEPLQSFVIQATEAVGCDYAFVALPLLAALASAVGNTRRIELKRVWSEPAIVWTAIVGDSGTMKSPAMELALRPLRQRQSQAIKRHAEVMDEYQTEAMRHELDLAAWKRSGGEGLPPIEPEQPVLLRCWCDDTTIEALAVLLLQNWRGLLMVRDELAGWLGGFDRYAQGKGSDVAKWIEMHGGRSIMVDRKTGQPRTIYVPRAAVSVTGSIQPATLQRALGRAYFENGLAARMLLANPPRRVKRWTETEIDPSIEQAIAAVFDQLFDLEPVEGPDGDPEPGIVRLSPSAKAAWIRFYNEHADEQVELSGDLSAAWSKLEGYAARLALVIHLVRWASGEVSNADALDEQSIAAGVALSRWFGRETERVYSILNEDEEGHDRRELVERIRRKGGKLTVRDLQRSSRAHSTSETAEAALEDLVQSGFGRWEHVPANDKGGRPTRLFALVDSADVDKTSQTSRN